jgi:hypothetical protein
VSAAAPHPKVTAAALGGALLTVLTATTGLAKHDPSLAAALATVAAGLAGYVTPAVKPKVPAVLKPKAKPKPAPRPLVMYDSIELATVPPSPQAVAGYVGGRWPTYTELVRRFPHARHLSIAVGASENADALDVESGDATPGEAAGWVQRQHHRGLKRPVLYTSLSGMQHLVDLLAHAGTPRQSVRLWSAHYTGHPHVCGPNCGFGLRVHADATQYTDKALGRNLDESLTVAGFFG